MNAVEKTKILLVEDDNLFLWALNQFLRREGYDVCQANSGELALEMAQKEFFDVVISDFCLPGLNGKELIKQVKSLSPLTKTVLISACQMEETGGTDESLLNAYLNKPIEFVNLKRLLRDLTAQTAHGETHRL